MAAGKRQLVFKSQIFSEDAVVHEIIVEFVGHHDAHLIGSKPLRNSMIGSSISSIQIRIYLQQIENKKYTELCSLQHLICYRTTFQLLWM